MIRSISWELISDPVQGDSDEPCKVKQRQEPPRGMTFPRQARLTKPFEFKQVFQKPVVSSDPCFKILARCNQADRSRLGMAVSRQVDRQAVGRNRIKRVIRESFRAHSATPHFDCVVLPRREAATISNSQLFRSLDRHWARIAKRCLENETKKQDKVTDG